MAPTFSKSRSLIGLMAGLCFVAATAQAAPADLDAGFGSGGKVITSLGSGSDRGLGVAVQSNGKILVAGYKLSISSRDIALVRYANTGTLDASFGSGGVVTTPIGHMTPTGVTDGYAEKVAVQSDGKIVVAGSAWNGSNYDFALVRYLDTGALDASFGSGGKVMTPVGSSDDYLNDMAVQSDGKIVVVGLAFASGGPRRFAVVRYTDNGELDTSFGFNGKVDALVGSSSDAWGLVVQPDGKILVAGSASNGSNSDFALARFTDTGELDTSFGSGGKVTTAIGSGSDTAFSLVLQSDGKIVLAGQSFNGTNFDVALARYTSTGALDPAFGSGGKVTTAVGSGDDIGESVAVQADGKIVVGGDSVQSGASYDFMVVRYTSAGALDPSFGSEGKVTTPIGSGDDIGHAMALQSDGKIVLAGYTGPFNGDQDIVLARYEGNAQPEIEVEQPVGTALTDNASTVAFGVFPVGRAAAAKTFTVRNSGPGALTLLAPATSGTNAADFALDTTAFPSSLTAGASATFTVTFTPIGAGVRTATLLVASNDADENPFEVALTGQGLSFTTDTDGDGLNDAAEFILSALGFDWQVAQTALVNTFYSNAGAAGLYTQSQYDANRVAGHNDVIAAPNGYNLYTLSQVQALHADAPLLTRDGNGRFTLTIGVQKATNLATGFTPFSFVGGQTAINAQGKIEFQFTTPDDAAFFRIEAK